MDEPTNGLDIPAKAAFRRLVASYADPERTVLISSHQVRDLDILIDSVIVLDQQGVVLNQSVDQITEKLWFGSLSDTDIPIYNEESLHGMIGITENRTACESKIDLELLFNATIRNRDLIHTLFNR